MEMTFVVAIILIFQLILDPVPNSVLITHVFNIK